MSPQFRCLSFGARLHRLRVQADESFQQVADATGMTKAHLWELEQGRADNPTLKTMLAICEHYDITIQKLVEGIKK